MAGPSEPDTGAYVVGSDDQTFASVIQVGRHEDVATICGRIDTAPSNAVVVSVPGGNRSLSREIGLRRVIRHAEETGRSIAFATSNSALASRARALRVPVARRPEHVRWDAGGRMVWRLAGRSIAIPAPGRIFQMLVILAFATLVGVAALTVGPAADIVVYPPSDRVEHVLTVTASTAIDEPDFGLLFLPAEEVTSTRLVTIAIPTTGTAMVGVKPAQLTVTATNTTSATVTIPAGSRLNTTAGVQFQVAAEATLVAGETKALGSVAIEPGERGNVGPGAITGFADQSLVLVRASNAGSGGGGGSEPRRAVAAADIETLIITAKALESVQAVRETIVADRPRDAILVDTAAVEIDQGTPSPLPGTVADVVVMEVRVHVTALAIVSGVLDQLGRHVLDAEGEVGELIPGSVTAVETGDRRSASEGEVTTQLRITGLIARGVTVQEVESAVRGRSASSARSILETRYGIQEADIDISPGWAPRLPRFGFRIDVEFRPPPDDDQTTAGNR